MPIDALLDKSRPDDVDLGRLAGELRNGGRGRYRTRAEAPQGFEQFGCADHHVASPILTTVETVAAAGAGKCLVCRQAQMHQGSGAGRIWRCPHAARALSP